MSLFFLLFCDCFYCSFVCVFCLFWGLNLVGFLGVVFLLYFCFFVKMLSSMNVISSIPSLIVIADAPNLPCIS